MKRLIVNADDLGAALCVNRGVERAHRDGILTSATLLANGPAFDDGVRVARDNPRLGVGVHLNLLRGRPVAPPDAVRPLLNDQGRFRFLFYELGKACRQPDVLAAAEIEYRAQIDRVFAAGIRPTHLDSEKHHAVWGPLARLAGRLAREKEIPALRSLREPVGFALRTLPWPRLGRAYQSLLLRAYVTFAHARTDRARPDYFFGQTHIGCLVKAVWLPLLRKLPDGVSEVMTHPGEYDEAELTALAEEFGVSWLAKARPLETAALVAPEVRAAAERAGAELVSFRTFAPEEKGAS